MKKLLPLLLLSVFFGFSQTTNKGEPASWSLNSNQKITKIEISTIDIQKIVEEDAINDLVAAKPYRIGVLTEIDYGFESGVWTNLPNGDRFWRLNISSKDALNLSVNFDNFYLPEGARLYLYNNEKSDLQGAYTSINNNNSNILGSWFVDGDNLWIEYFEPSNVKGQGSLHLTNIIHGYRLAGKHQLFTEEQKALNDSGNCNQDVDCPVGADFEPIKNEVKHSIAFLNLGNGFICSGGLINNVNNDKTPYFLTANHCFNAGGGTNPAQYSMRFNWITSGTPRCGTTTNTQQGPMNFVMNGSTLKAKSEQSDFMLVELNNAINPTWDIRYSGWDRTDTNPTFEVGIHHPSGDIMKVCRDDSGASKVNVGGVPTWFIGGLNNSNQATFGTNGWEIGVTEGGSSGSPLFDQNGRVIGQLWAGLAACTGTNDNNKYDYYGRFATSWIGDGTNSTRLSNWLDPDNTGATTVDTLDHATAAINDELLAANINVYPNPTSSNITIDLGNLSGKFNFKVINTLGQEVLVGKINNTTTSINLSNLTSSIYLIKVTDTSNNRSFVKKVIKK